MGQPKMLVILIKQIHAILFFLLSFKRIASKIDKLVILVIYCCSTNAFN